MGRQFASRYDCGAHEKDGRRICERHNEKLQCTFHVGHTSTMLVRSQATTDKCDP